MNKRSILLITLAVLGFAKAALADESLPQATRPNMACLMSDDQWWRRGRIRSGSNLQTHEFTVFTI